MSGVFYDAGIRLGERIERDPIASAVIPRNGSKRSPGAGLISKSN
jgi:hypothetical protein